MTCKNLVLSIIIIVSIFIIKPIQAKDYLIYSIVHELPMGDSNKKPIKNYYINMGSVQGVGSGTILNVYRKISTSDPFQTKNRYDYHLKIGQLKILHSEENASIGKLHTMFDGNDSPFHDVNALIIGDKVDVNLN